MTSQPLHHRNFLLHLWEQAGYDQPVLIKEPTSESPNNLQIKQLHNEYAITRHLEGITGVRQAYDKKGIQSHPILLLEYIPGRTISELVDSSALDMQQKLRIAIETASILDRIHQHGVTHKDINSNNILVAENGSVHIIDFGIATSVRQEIAMAPSRGEVFVGTLAYTSPEQTGRMNRLVDYRSDLYSLGVTLYELFTGLPPFQTDDTMEMIHAHIAIRPVPPNKRDEEIAEPLSDIILKLLAKNAEDRYQTANGLKSDLIRFQDQLDTNGRIEAFVLGVDDFSTRLQIPQKLYGRQTEIAQILATFDRVTQGRTELLLVAGYSGVGKTSLVHEIYKPVVAKRGIFIEGKFDQYQRSTPYSAWGHAFNRLVTSWLTESEINLSHLKTAILDAVGDNGQLLINLIPNLTHIIGPQPDPDTLDGEEGQNRFNYVFQRFINAIATPDYPLVIFLDDMQWIDLASINLLKKLLIDQVGGNFLVIGAYRDNEVDRTHPLILELNDIQKTGATVNQIALDNLAQEDIIQLLADSLHTPHSSCLLFAQLLHDKTGGNAFFTHQYLLSLEEMGQLWFDINDRSWQWDLAELKNLAISDNVIDLMVGKISKFPEGTREVLKIAACLGNQFELSLFTQVTGQSSEELQEVLHSAYQDGFLVRFNGYHKFAHDRIQQAAYSMISDSEKVHLHQRIGQTLLQTLPQAQDKYLFDTIGHLNLAIPLIQSETKRVELAELNLKAARNAMKAAAYNAVVVYAQNAIDLLGVSSWQNHYGLMLELYHLAAEAAFLTKDFESSLQYADTVLDKAQSRLDKIPATITKIRLYHAQNQMEEALHTGRAAVLELGFVLEKSAPINLSAETITELPKMKDPVVGAAMEVLQSIHHTTYVARFEQFPSVVYTALHLMLRFGVHPSCSTWIYLYSLLIWREDIESAYQFSILSLRLAEKSNDKRNLVSAKIGFATVIQHWKTHYRNLDGELRSGFQMGLECGERVISSSSLTTHSFMTYFVAHRLDQVQDTMTKNLELQRKIGEAYPAYSIIVWAQFVANLRGLAADPFELEGQYFSEARDLSLSRAANLIAATFYTHCLKLVLHYHLGDYLSAYDNSIEAEPLLPQFEALLVFSLFVYYQSLAILQLLDGQDQRSSLNEKLADNIKSIRLWAQHAPMNQKHRLDLLLAEKARVEGNVAAAIDHYEAAITGARENEYISEEALANELYGRFWAQRGNAGIARVYLKEAHTLYSHWGAIAIVEYLEAQFPLWLEIDSLDIESPSYSTTPDSTSYNFDTHTILKASQEISSEIELNSLLAKLMTIVIENAGAQRGYLILEQDGQLMIVAQVDQDKTETDVTEAKNITETDLLAKGIVHYVAHTQQTVLLEDALQSGDFVDDPYIQRNEVKSLLCTPLINQGKISAILYLENNLSPGVFTPERVDLLNLLSSQMAISIDNARIHQQLEKLLEERSKALSSAEAQIRSIFESSPLGIALTSYEGEFMSINKALQKMLRISEDEEHQWRIGDFYAEPADRETLLAALQELGSLQDFGVQLRRKDGDLFYASVNISRLVLQGNEALLSIIEDVTDGLGAKQQTAIAIERERLARELHDAVTQTLFSASVMAEAAPKIWEADQAMGRQYLGQLPVLLRGALAEMRSLLLELRPHAFKDITLGQLIEPLTDTMRAYTNAEVTLEVECDSNMPEDVTRNLHRIVQECLNNITKHAEASQIDIYLCSDDKGVEIQISDNGLGFDPQSISPGSMGIDIMRDRARKIDAELSIKSQLGSGTQIKITWPGRENSVK